MSVRDRETKKQQETNLTLPLPDLAKRWVQLLNIPQAEIQPANIPDNLIITDSAARTTVNQLEELPTLRANVVTLQTLVDNGNTLLKERDNVVVGLNNQVGGLQEEITKQAALNKTEQDKLKADARRSKRNWLIRGLVVGAAGAAYALHAVGLF